MDRSRDAERLWALAVELNAGLSGRAGNVTPDRTSPRALLPPLWFVTDPERTPRPWEIAARLPAGAGVIYRAFGAENAAEIGHRLRAATVGPLLVGLDPDLARIVGADGVHLPERALDRVTDLRAHQPNWMITGAVHGGTEPQRASGLDAALISPVFTPGGTSAGKPPLGVEAFGRIAATLPCPAYALGGIGPQNAPALRGSGACGVAIVDAAIRLFSAD